MLLYHGSHEDTDSIHVHEMEPPWEIFDGVFASPSRDAALSHGDYLYAVEIPKEEVLESGFIRCASERPNNISINNEFWANLIGKRYNPEDLDLWYEALVEESYDQTDPVWFNLLGISDPAEIGWHLQNLRGRLAAALGYRAAEMRDEHGISYFLVPGNVLTRIEDE